MNRKWIVAFLVFAGIVVSTNAQQDTAFISLLNSVRAKPSSFIKTIDEYYYQWRSFVADVKGLEKAIAEIKQRLKSQKKLPALTFDSTLAKAAYDHALDCYNMNLLGHIGSDKSDPTTRIARYGKWAAMAECITYGQKKTSMMLAAMLVDEGTPNRGHRESLLSNKYTSIGVAVMGHMRYDFQCVAVLASH